MAARPPLRVISNGKVYTFVTTASNRSQLARYATAMRHGPTGRPIYDVLIRDRGPRTAKRYALYARPVRERRTTTRSAS